MKQRSVGNLQQNFAACFGRVVKSVQNLRDDKRLLAGDKNWSAVSQGLDKGADFGLVRMDLG